MAHKYFSVYSQKLINIELKETPKFMWIMLIYIIENVLFNFQDQKNILYWISAIDILKSPVTLGHNYKTGRISSFKMSIQFLLQPWNIFFSKNKKLRDNTIQIFCLYLLLFFRLISLMRIKLKLFLNFQQTIGEKNIFHKNFHPFEK